MITTIKHKNDEFFSIPLKHVNRYGTLKLWAIAHENGHKTRKQRVLSHTLKHLSGLTIVLNRTETLKPWAIDHENDHKTPKDKFLVVTLKHVNCPGTPKLSEIAHESSHKTQKRWAYLSDM